MHLQLINKSEAKLHLDVERDLRNIVHLYYSFVAFRGRQGFNWGYTGICGQYWGWLLLLLLFAYSVEQTLDKMNAWHFPGICCTIFTPYFSKPGLPNFSSTIWECSKDLKVEAIFGHKLASFTAYEKSINRDMDNEIFFGLNLYQRIILSVRQNSI